MRGIMKKKILMVTMGLNIGGAETHVMELTKELHRLGYDVHVASNGGVYAGELEAMGIPHFQMPLHKRQLGAMLKSYRMLSALIRRERYDIVHGHARIPSFLCGLLHKKYGFRFVTTAHLDFLVTPLLRKITNWGERTLAVSEDIRDYLAKEYGVDPDHVEVTVNGVDMERFSAAIDPTPVLKEFHLKPERRRIVYISRIDGDRSAPAFHLVEIASELRKEFPDVDVIIVGGGNDFERLQEQTKIVNDAAAAKGDTVPLVTLTGPRSDINLFTAAADIFCGVSRSTLEAMSAECPVIVTGNQGYLGIFSEATLQIARDTNFCCRGCPLPTKEMLLADLRKELSASKEALKAQGEYNRSIIQTYYSVNRMAMDYLALYDHLPPATVFRRGDVVVSGYYGFGNSGDDMILQSIIAGLRRVDKDIKITALTNDPQRMSSLYEVRCVNRFRPLSTFFAIRNSKLLIFGGGTLLQDTTSTKSLHYYTNVMRLAHWGKTKLYVYANGIGPLRKSHNRKIVKDVLQHAAVISVREPDSRNELIQLGVAKERIRITADPVFLLSDEAFPFRPGLLTGSKGYFGISLRESHLSDAAGRLFEEEIVKAICAIREKYKLTPVLLPMQPRKDDNICRRIMVQLGDDAVFASPLSTNEMVSLIGRLQLVIGMRLHSLIFAAKASVPMIGLAYDPKIYGFLQYIQEPYVFSLEDVTAEKLLRDVDAIMDSYDTVVSRLKKASEEMNRLAQEEISAVLSEIEH